MNQGADLVVASRADAASWHARLELGYERCAERTVLTSRSHVGPLVVQKSLYPEGDAVCQNIVVHPPGGMVGGDRLALDVELASRAHAQLTTPGAAKWYRSSDATAHQSIDLHVAAGAALEWLPQEAILFNGAIAEFAIRIEVDPQAVFIGWDIVCLGRTAAGERFARGQLRQRIELWRDGALWWCERAVLTGDAPLLASPVGLIGQPVFGTLLAAAPQVSDELLAACKSVAVAGGEAAVTRLPALLVARYRGASAASARDYFTALWRTLRPALIGRDAVPPRIWST